MKIFNLPLHFRCWFRFRFRFRFWFRFIAKKTRSSGDRRFPTQRQSKLHQRTSTYPCSSENTLFLRSAASLTMFAKPKKVAPAPRLSEVDRSFTKIAKPLVSRSTLNSPKVGFSPDDSLEGVATEESSLATEIIPPSPTNRTGDYRSYYVTSQNYKSRSFYLEKRNAKRMYRVLICKENAVGKKLLIDSLDGKIYCDGFTYKNRYAKDIVLFESKSAALSERYPFNQVAASRGGNGTLPRILVAFDAWGQCRRRYGGGPSVRCDNAMAMNIVEFLDPPHPVPSRLSEKYAAPNFYTKSDKTKPNRERSDHWFKINRFFGNQ